jgi:hypothetical protein
MLVGFLTKGNLVSIQFNRWPYGCYIHDNETVIFDRTFKPIVRMTGRYPNHDPASAVAVSLKERVFSLRPLYFYRSKDDPRYDGKTRFELKQLIDSIPVLHDLIETRTAPKPRPLTEVERVFG